MTHPAYMSGIHKTEFMLDVKEKGDEWTLYPNSETKRYFPTIESAMDKGYEMFRDQPGTEIRVRDYWGGMVRFFVIEEEPK